MNRSPMFTLISSLIASGQLTGVTPALRLDGEPFLPEGDDQPDPSFNDYDGDDFSDDASEYGGRMVRQVEDFRHQLSISNDAVNRQLAAEMPQYFVRTDDQALEENDRNRYFADLNHQQGWMLQGWLSNRDEEPAGLTDYQMWTPRYFSKGDTPHWNVNVRPGAPHVQYNRRGGNPEGGVANHRMVIGFGATAETILGYVQKWYQAEYKARTGRKDVDFSPLPE
jgi:hypothetical protein